MFDLLEIPARELAHRRLVRERHDNTLDARAEQPLDILERRARDDAQVWMTLRHLAQARDVRAARRVPGVAELARAAKRAVGVAPDPDLGRRRRKRLGGRVLVRPEAAHER